VAATGTTAGTLDDATLTATGTVQIQGALAVTLEDAILEPVSVWRPVAEPGASGFGATITTLVTPATVGESRMTVSLGGGPTSTDL